MTVEKIAEILNGPLTSMRFYNTLQGYFSTNKAENLIENNLIKTTKMEQKQIKIDIPEGYEINKEKSTFECIVFKKIEKTLPKSFYELNYISGYFHDSNGKVKDITHFNVKGPGANLIFPTKEQVEAALALAQLLQLRKVYNDGWEPNWNSVQQKHVIEISYDTPHYNYYFNAQKTLSFKTKELCDEFLKNFKDLIEIAKPLL